jgi:hypothetical protein
LDVFIDWQQCHGDQRSQLLASDGTVVAANCSDQFVTLPEDDYTLRVYSINQNYGDYKFKIWEVPSPDGPFPYQLGDVATGNNQSPGAEETWTFTVPAGGLDVFIDWQQCHGDQRSQLLASDGTVVAANCSDQFVTLPEDDYTLRVYSINQNYGDYRFSIVVPQGDWVGTYGAGGYVLAAWNGTSDVVSLPSASVTVVQGSRYRWSSSTGAPQALQAPDESYRRAATYYDNTQLQVRLDFTADYSGLLHLYSVDWDTSSRRQIVTVDDGSGSQQMVLDGPFNMGAWMHFPINVTSGASVTITMDRTAGYNAVLAGIFLDEGE